MRLGTWNCQKDIVNHWDVLERLSVDVVAVQECGKDTPEAAASRGWDCDWRPGGWDKGIAVLSRGPFKIASVEAPEPFYISAEIEGPQRFRFVCFWAMTTSFAGAEYPEQATRMIEQLPRDGVPTVIGGDFNASRSAAHLTNVERLAEMGLVSAYHTLHGVEQLEVASHAADFNPTLYWKWQRANAYHMDFMFVPKAWAISAVEVGSFDDYVSTGISDHVPLIATLEPEG